MLISQLFSYSQNKYKITLFQFFKPYCNQTLLYDFQVESNSQINRLLHSTDNKFDIIQIVAKNLEAKLHMSNQIKQYLRLSPYQHKNILNFHPTALLSPNPHFKNLIEIPSQSSSISQFISYNNYQPQQPQTYLQQTCYFCQKVSTVQTVHSQCGECKKVVCKSCEHSCGKCGKKLCQLDCSYDYSLQKQSCFSC